MLPAPRNERDGDLLSRWSDVDRWRKRCPFLTVSDQATSAGGVGEGGKRSDSSRACERATPGETLSERLIDDGYALLDDRMGGDGLRERVARGITELEVQHSLPATFILLFDEPWQLAAQSHRLLLRGDGGERRGGILSHADRMSFNFDVLAWHIDPRRNQAGFSPHRDRQPETASELEQSFYADGTAKYVTHWIALTDATPENSCLYAIPKGCDPGYLKGDDPPAAEHEGEDKNEGNMFSEEDNEQEQQHVSDPLRRALPSKQSYQNIRALPRGAGQSLVFTHRLLHWGSKGNRCAVDVRPRIAISFVYSDTEFEPPYLLQESKLAHGPDNGNDGKRSAPPPFAVRLLLVCAQLLSYYQRFQLSTPTLRACYEYCKANSDQLNAAYRKKVFVEYVKAMKESRDGTLNSDRDSERRKDDDEKTHEIANSEDEEALLEEMLNHSDEFDDDFDDVLCDRKDVVKKRKYIG